MKSYLATSALLFLISLNGIAQPVKIPFTLENWDTLGVQNFKTEMYMGKESVFLPAHTAIYTKGLDLRDGTIEVDMNFPETRNFPGIGFRMQNLGDFEMFYVGGPRNSGNPDATRYSPLFGYQQAWQLYYGPGYCEPFKLKFNTWHHIKIDAHGAKAEVYIDDMKTPVIKVPELKREPKGGNIILIPDDVAIHFANVQYTRRPPVAKTTVAIPANGANGIVTQWQVSNVIDRSLFETKYQLTPEIKQKLAWTKQSTDSFGIMNFSRFATLGPTTNTMVAKLIIDSRVEQMKALSFGFSDQITVYLNDKTMFIANDIYGSRDYQFLGTMGFHDTLLLPLKKGENELWFVVSDYFGGWGLKAKLENMENVSLR